jgi:DNA replication protein DnaC
MTHESKCILASQCKKAGDPDHCHSLCYPYLKTHGFSGSGGIVGLADIPAAYTGMLLSSLPIQADNPEAFAFVSDYVGNIVSNVDQGIGFYFFSIPNKDNPKGTGTGKTTATAALLNEYIVARVVLHMKQERLIEGFPALFVNVSKFQNAFNAQFRGTPDMQQDASRKYYSIKRNMIAADLLALDDIGLRDATPAFLSEMYEILDDRSGSKLATLLSSNVPLSDLSRSLDERIASRIDGMTEQIAFRGKDHRKGGALGC